MKCEHIQRLEMYLCNHKLSVDTNVVIEGPHDAVPKVTVYCDKCDGSTGGTTHQAPAIGYRVRAHA